VVTSVEGLASKSVPSLVGCRATSVSPAIHDYYMEGHARARVSPTMAKASRELTDGASFVG
jgi:hypothetical protein